MPRNALTFFFSQQHKKFSSQNILHTEYCSKMQLPSSKYQCHQVVQLRINIFCIIWQKTQAIYTKKESCCRKEQKFLKNHIHSSYYMTVTTPCGSPCHRCKSHPCHRCKSHPPPIGQQISRHNSVIGASNHAHQGEMRQRTALQYV